MSIIPRFLSILFLVAVILPLVASHSVGDGNRNCRSNEFWHEDNKCCLRRGGPPSPPPPPRGTNCPPGNWYWGREQGCCLPRNPPPSGSPPPQCPEGWKWYPFLKKCLPRPTPPTPHPPQPSGHGGHWKRDMKSREDRLCPSGLDACPIAGSLAGDYECIDVASELESCGGCASVGQGQDCTAIPGVWNVGCELGACKVYSCSFGYKRSHDGTSCVPF